MALIESVETARSARPGESVRVQVTIGPLAPPGTAVTIAGIAASDVWLQAPSRLGEWRFQVVAGGGGELATVDCAIEVTGTPRAPLLDLVRNPFIPLGAVVRAVDIDPANPQLMAGDSYHWRLGTTEMTTTVPIVSHDFESDVDDVRRWSSVPVELTVRHAEGSVHVARRTLVLGSLYRVLRDDLSQVRPKVRCDGQALQDDTLSPRYRGRFAVTNIEPTGLAFTLRRVEWLSEADTTASFAPDEQIQARLSAGESTEMSVTFDRRQAPPGAHGASVHLFGQTDDGLPVHTSAVFDLIRRQRPKLRLPLLMGTPSILDKVAQAVKALGAPTPEVGPRPDRWGDVRITGVTQESLWALELSQRTPGAAQPMPVLGGDGPAKPTGSTTVETTVETTAETTVETTSRRRPGARTTAPAWVSTVADVLGVENVLDLLSPGGVTVGAPCDPDNLPDEIPEFFGCQFTGEFADVPIKGRVVNARRGDIVLVPGGNGLIGGLLAQVEPAQRYAHCGIMTRNFTEISHATSSDDRLREFSRGVHPLGADKKAPTDGFEPDALRFQWPGAITQSAESAYGGSHFTSPEGQKYRIAAFTLSDKAYLNGHWQLIPAIVLKPHPQAEYADPGLRQRLHKVADEARGLSVTEADTAAGKQSKVHYRFFCYTDAALAVRPSPQGVQAAPPASAGWAVGTTPAVCSSYVWLAARRAAEKLEGPGPVTQPLDLEPPDLAAGAAVDDQTLDGMYFYTERERQLAGVWLFNYLVDKIFADEQKEGGWFGGILNEAFSDMADDCANQICNTFASDYAGGDAKNSDRWRRPGVGRAVSPDNMMFWDDPQRDGSGLWGYAEPLIYHQARVERMPVTQWRKTGGRGTLRGQVRFLGKPVPYAWVNARRHDHERRRERLLHDVGPRWPIRTPRPSRRTRCGQLLGLAGCQRQAGQDNHRDGRPAGSAGQVPTRHHRRRHQVPRRRVHPQPL